MELIDGVISRDFTADEDVEIAGTALGNVVVTEGTHVVITGAVAGDVANDGGTLEIYGQIDGRLVHREGETDVADGASIARGVIGLDRSDER